MTQAAVPGGGRHGADRSRPVSVSEVTAPVRERTWRDRLRSKPGLGHAWRLGVFLVGTFLVALGLVLTVLPGPLTIPPVLLGLWVLSTEFAWAHRFLEICKERARAAWAHAVRRPASTTLVTVGGLAVATAGFWVVRHFDLIDQARVAAGL
jgi:hypothetical protein